jgi:hypothetical protein
MKTFSKIIFSSAAVLVAGLSIAQGGGQGGGQGRGGFGQRGGMGRANEVTLLMREDVQRDLALSTDQIAKLPALQEKFGRNRRGQGAGAGGGQRGQGGGQGGGQRGQGGGQRTPPTEQEQAAMAEAQAKRNAEMKAAVAEVLNAKQIARLKQIGYQLQGSQALLNPETQKELMFNETQSTQAKALQDKLREAMSSLMEKMRNQEIDREGMQESMRKNNDILKSELEKLLTGDQKKAWADMQGAPFKADTPG